MNNLQSAGQAFQQSKQTSLRVNDIPHAFSELQSEVERLQKNIEELQQKLSPVVMASPQEVPGNSPLKQECRVPLAEQMLGYAHTIKMSNGRLETIINGLQL